MKTDYVTYTSFKTEKKSHPQHYHPHPSTRNKRKAWHVSEERSLRTVTEITRCLWNDGKY